MSLTRLDFLNLLAANSGDVDGLLDKCAKVMNGHLKGEVLLALMSMMTAHMKEVPEHLRYTIICHTMDMIWEMSAPPAVRKLDS